MSCCIDSTFQRDCVFRLPCHGKLVQDDPLARSDEPLSLLVPADRYAQTAQQMRTCLKTDGTS